jgi:hypothetical protein
MYIIPYIIHILTNIYLYIVHMLLVYCPHNACIFPIYYTYVLSTYFYVFNLEYCPYTILHIVSKYNTELAIHALDQVHCWDTYFHLRIGHYGNFTPLNFQTLLLSKQ